MRLTVLALLVLVLAGCAHPPPPEAPAPAPEPEPLRSELPVAITMGAASNVVCPPPVSCSQGGSEVLVELAANQTMTGFRLAVSASGLFGTPPPQFHVEVRCSGGPACRDALARAEGTGPFTLASNATLPPLSVVTVEATSLDDSPDPFGFRSPFLAVEGTVSVAAVPGPPPRVEQTPLHLDGVSGMCAFDVEPGCTTFPQGMSLDVDTTGVVRRLDLTATWTPSSSASETMRIAVYCYGEGCPPGLSVEGKSPLRLDAYPPPIPAGSTLRMWLEWTTPYGLPVRQEFTFDGTLETIVEPDA